MTPEVSIVTLCHGRWPMTRRCLKSVRRCTAAGSYELLAVDNASPDGTWAGLRALKARWPELRTRRNGSNLPFARAMNRALPRLRGRNIVWLNNDALVTPGWAEELLRVARSAPRAGAVGPRTNGSWLPWQSAGRPEGLSPRALSLHAAAVGLEKRRGFEPAPALWGFCMLVPRAAAEAVGPLDERFVWGNEDVDYCLRLRAAGYRLYAAGRAFVYHRLGGTRRAWSKARRRLADERNERLLREKWPGRRRLFMSLSRGKS